MTDQPTPLRRAARAIDARVRRARFPGSAVYWETRYADGGDSGAGSYGVNATFKARILNEFVASNGITSVLELGCGDGNQLSLATYPRYLGLDVSATAIDRCIAQFDDPTKSFILYDPKHLDDGAGWLTADMAMSLDVLFHLIEDVVFDRYMRLLFDAAQRFVVVYSSNEELTVADHVRHRKFTDWVESNRPDWRLDHVQPNENPGSVGRVDFYMYRRTG